MRVILQRVLSANVKVDGNTVGQIGKGYMVLFGACVGDTLEDALLLAKKTAQLRVFSDNNDKMNLSISDINGEALVISNFTLYADSKKGRRPSFSNAAPPTLASELYDEYCNFLNQNGIQNVRKGIFGADMKVELINDGPVTIILDTKELK